MDGRRWFLKNPCPKQAGSSVVSGHLARRRKGDALAVAARHSWQAASGRKLASSDGNGGRERGLVYMAEHGGLRVTARLAQARWAQHVLGASLHGQEVQRALGALAAGIGAVEAWAGA
ncbi:hypothetical protein GGX14DRAFT_384513 [Mycena pura]|uniref:Uncharacterized protein n=1 Tax=Mycena pura TaxID=153505 RepID=A0AAD6YVV4_9AGAR|nr:hypothetical protein GGX14DRAFT_384513 [Mycena pura]